MEKTGKKNSLIIPIALSIAVILIAGFTVYTVENQSAANTAYRQSQFSSENLIMRYSENQSIFAVYPHYYQFSPNPAFRNQPLIPRGYIDLIFLELNISSTINCVLNYTEFSVTMQYVANGSTFVKDVGPMNAIYVVAGVDQTVDMVVTVGMQYGNVTQVTFVNLMYNAYSLNSRFSNLQVECIPASL